jgi:hypothetical protein
MFDLNDEDVLTRVYKYELYREEGRLFIDVYEYLNGERKGKFMAVPNLVMSTANEAFFGKGDSETGALQDCLSRIKSVDTETIISNTHSE